MTARNTSQSRRSHSFPTQPTFQILPPDSNKREHPKKSLIAMKFLITLFTTLLACLFFTQTASAGWSPINGRDATDCSNKYGSTVNAIGKFCTKNGSNGLIVSLTSQLFRG